MSKRTPGLPRAPLGFYPTPEAAVHPLLRHLPRRPTAYVEPCAGDGALVRALAELWPWGTCALACDLAPRRAWIEEADARTVALPPAALVVTNPPWSTTGSRGEPVISMAQRFADHAPTWLLLPHSFAANRYFGAIAPSCVRIVPIGRVSWLGNGRAGYDDVAWYLFDAKHVGATIFHARAA